MAFLKRYWLYTSIGLVALLCVVLGAFLVRRANQPVEIKTVYAMPKPNPERAEILKRALQPPKHVYAMKASGGDGAVEDTTADNPDSSNMESSSRENEFEDADLDLFPAELDEDITRGHPDFPDIPDGYIGDNGKPVWLSIPGYKKGDMPDQENISRVLIKLWNQGTRGFKGGFLDHTHDRVYPLYDDVLYVEWDEKVIDYIEGQPPFIHRSIVAHAGNQGREFEPEDFAVGGWDTKYPGVKFVEFKDAGYDPATFLTDED